MLQVYFGNGVEAKTPPPPEPTIKKSIQEPQIKYSPQELFVARVLYSETSSIATTEEKIAICRLIQNRIRNKAFGGGRLLTAYDVCKQPKAFSCVNSSSNINWSEFKPNLNKNTIKACQLAKILMYNKAKIANYSWTSDIVYYHDKSIEKPAKWDNKYWRAVLVKETKNFKFYKIVPNKPKVKKRGKK